MPLCKSSNSDIAWTEAMVSNLKPVLPQASYVFVFTTTPSTCGYTRLQTYVLQWACYPGPYSELI